nr:hypothetical protein [Tanacetum cinerariifolium]
MTAYMGYEHRVFNKSVSLSCLVRSNRVYAMDDADAMLIFSLIQDAKKESLRLLDEYGYPGQISCGEQRKKANQVNVKIDLLSF